MRFHYFSSRLISSTTNNIIITSTTTASTTSSHTNKLRSCCVTLLFFILLAFPLDYCGGRQWSSRVVSTRLGLTRGYLFLPKGYDGVEVFLALPYASAPVGSLRFMPPVSGSPWSGTKMTEKPAPVCPQVLPSIENDTHPLDWMPAGRLTILKRLLPLLKNQSEDCLYLNIYVPLSMSVEKMKQQQQQHPSSSFSNSNNNGGGAGSGGGGGLLPVLVFVHGDDYGYGGGHPYDPSMLASQGQVIVVTMNYRLGILGFLNANSDGYFKSPANFALLDQIAALHWVQENIGYFGGDKTNVTLMGHGLGSIFANFLMISSAVPTGNLFHRVILMSGSALSPSAIGSVGFTNGKDLAKKFSTSVKCPNEPPSEMLNCLRQIPLQYFLDSELWSLFGPSEDGITIEEDLKEPVLRDRMSHYPLLFGVTKVEMLPYLNDHDAVYGIEAERRRESLKTFIVKHFSVHRNEILAAAIHEYTDWERPVQHPISVRDETLDALADAQVVAPLTKTGDIHSQSNSKSYFYVFEYQMKGSDYQQRLGCVHGEDLLFVFGVPLYFYGSDSSTKSYSPPPSSSSSSGSGGSGNGGGGGGEDGGLNSSIGNESSETSLGNTSKLGFYTGNFTRNEVQLSQTVIHYWANFIRTGNPNEDIDEDVGPNILTGAANRLSSSSISDKSKSKVVEWPPYDPLYKKYLVLDLKARSRTHYRAHKLSFWLHLVPDLMKNGYGLLSGNHHLLSIGNVDGGESSPSSSHNSSATPPPPTIQLVGPPMWEHNSNTNSNNGKPRDHFFQGNSSIHEGGSTGSVTGGGGQEGDGYQIYSTALSVTIAIGCSLLILNILIFAAFYYQRDKRRNDANLAYIEGNPSSQQCTSYGVIGVGGGGGSESGSTTGTGMAHTQFHRKENGQIGQQLQQQHQQQYQIQHHHQQQQQPSLMPNICGDLPSLIPSDCELQDGSNYGTQQQMSRGTLRRQKQMQQQQQQQYQQQQQQHPNPYEMAMPDAIIAAAMMNMQNFPPPQHLQSQGSYSDDFHQHSSPHGVGGMQYSSATLATPTSSRSNTLRRSSLTMKEQLQQQQSSGQNSSCDYGDSSGGGGGGGMSRTMPRPPRRSTPSVKFSTDTSMGGCDGGDVSSSNSANESITGSSKLYKPQILSASQTSTLKPSLKKSSSYKPMGMGMTSSPSSGGNVQGQGNNGSSSGGGGNGSIDELKV